MLQKAPDNLSKDSAIANSLLYAGNRGLIVLHEDSLFLDNEVLEETKEQLERMGIKLIRENSFLCG